MNLYMNKVEFAAWTGVGRTFIYTNDDCLVLNTKGKISVIESAELILARFKSSNYTRTKLKNVIFALEAKIKAHKITPPQTAKLTDPIYINTGDVVDRLSFYNANEYLAFMASIPDPIEGIKTNQHKETLFLVEDVDEFAEKHRRPGLSNKYAKQFIRGQYAPKRENK